MSLRSKLANAINSADPPEQDTIFERALDRLRNLEAKVPEIEQRANQLDGELQAQSNGATFDPLRKRSKSANSGKKN